MTRHLATTWGARIQAAPGADDEGSGDDLFDREEVEPQQERPLWPDQVVAANSFTTWRNEEATRRGRGIPPEMEEIGGSVAAAGLCAGEERLTI